MSDLKLLGLMTIVTITLIAAVTVLCYIGDSISCKAKWPQQQTDYSFFAGCMVHYKGEWVNSNNIRVL